MKLFGNGARKSLILKSNFQIFTFELYHAKWDTINISLEYQIRNIGVVLFFEKMKKQ